MAVTPTSLRTNVAEGTTGRLAETNTLHGAVNQLTNLAAGPLYLRDVTTTNGAVDNTAALQGLVDSVGVSAGVPAVPIELGTGTIRLTSTITILKRGVRFIGEGVGNPTTFTSAPGRGSTFVWDGPAGVPMFHVLDAQNVSFEDVLIVGNTTNRPSELIYFESAGGSVGTNSQIKLRNVRLGNFSWTVPDTPDGALTANYGIRFGGLNQNNDQMSLQDVFFADCGVGLSLDNTQSIFGESQNVCFHRCDTAGFRTYSDHTMFNATFNECGIDIETNSTAQVSVFGWYSENSSQIFEVNGLSSLNVRGGRWTVDTPMTGLSSFAKAPALASNLSLENVKIMYQITPKPPLYIRATYAVTPYTISIRGCEGLDDIAQLDIQGYGAAGKTYLDINSQGIEMSGTLTNVSVATYPRRFVGIGTPEAVITAPVGSTYARKNGSTGTTLYVKESGTGNTGWASMGSGGGSTAMALASGVSTMPRGEVNSGAIGMSSGTMRLSFFPAERSFTAGNVRIGSGTTAAGATPTLVRVGVYSVDGSGNLTLAGSIASDTTLLAAASTSYTRAITTPFPIVQGQMYAVGVLVVTAAATPTLPGQALSGALSDYSLAPRLCGAVSGQTDLPGSVPFGSLGDTSVRPLVIVLP